MSQVGIVYIKLSQNTIIYPGELISIDSNGEGINGSEDDKLMSLEYGLSGDVIKCLIKN